MYEGKMILNEEDISKLKINKKDSEVILFSINKGIKFLGKKTKRDNSKKDK